MEDGVATRLLRHRHGGDRRGVPRAAAQAGDHVVDEPFLFGNTNSLFGRRGARCRGHFVDATDAARRGARSRRRRGWSSSRRSPTRARRSPTSTGSARSAPRRDPLRRRQHDDLAVAVSSEGGRRRPRRQRADQVHRRPRQRARRQRHRHRPLRLDALPQHRRPTRRSQPALWGIQQIRKKGLRDWGGTLSAEQAHHIAVGAETLALRMERACANAQALAA